MARAARTLCVYETFTAIRNDDAMAMKSGHKDLYGSSALPAMKCKKCRMVKGKKKKLMSKKK